MKQANYNDLKNILDETVTKLQDPDVDIDEAIILHEKAKELIDQLEDYLEKAELKVKKATGK